jgi:hypothetical protein
MVRRLQAFFVLLIALVGFASATIVGVRSSQQVTHERDLAVSAGLISESENLGQARRRLAAQLSIAAWDVNHSSAARYAMLAAAARYPIAAHTWPMSLTAAAFVMGLLTGKRRRRQRSSRPGGSLR